MTPSIDTMLRLKTDKYQGCQLFPPSQNNFPPSFRPNLKTLFKSSKPIKNSKKSNLFIHHAMHHGIKIS